MEILVEGCAERQVRPELGELQLGLEHEGDDREFVVDLTSDLARRFSEAVAPLHPRAVVSWGLEPVRVCTWRSQRRGALRYRALAEATVVFRDFQALADFAVGWGAAPGVEVRHTSWKLTPETEQKLEDELLTEAVRAARRRADIMARAAGAARSASFASSSVDDDVPSEDDEDAEEAGVVGLEVVKRLLGAKVLEEITVTQERR